MSQPTGIRPSAAFTVSHKNLFFRNHYITEGQVFTYPALLRAYHFHCFGQLHFQAYIPDLYCTTGIRLFCCLYRSSCNIILVLIRIRSEQQEEQDRHEDQCYNCSNSESTGACDNQTDLVYTKCYNISKYVLEDDRKPEPFSGLHLMCHCRDCCKTRRIKQVEQQEGECCYCTSGTML